MEKNDLLKQSLVKHYSKLSSCSESELTVKMESTDWWTREDHRLQTEQKISKALAWLFALCFVVFAILSVKTMNDPDPLKVPLFTLISFTLALVFSSNYRSRISEKIKFFELLKLLFVN
jgi:hypothetical protein